MRHFLFLLVSFLSYTSYSQDSTITLSKFELFTSQSNKILKKEIKQVGNFGWRNINVFKTTDITTGTSMYAIRIGNFGGGDMPDFIHPWNTYIDFSDLDSVISALNTFLAEAEKPSAQTDVEFSYITPNDIVFTAYYDRSSNTWQYRMGKLYKQLRTYIPQTITKFNDRRFPEFIALLKEAKTLNW